MDLFPLEELHNLKEINVNKTQHGQNIKKISRPIKFSYLFIYLDVPRRYPNVENDAFVVPLLNFVWRIVFPFLNVLGQPIPKKEIFPP